MKKSTKILSAVLLFTAIEPVPTTAWAESIATTITSEQEHEAPDSTLDSILKMDTLNVSTYNSVDSWMPDQQLQGLVLLELIYAGVLPSDATVSNITKKHMENLNYLVIDLYEVPVATIQGLEYAVNLTELIVTNAQDDEVAVDLNELFDLSPLYELPLIIFNIEGYLPYNSDFKTRFEPFLVDGASSGISISLGVEAISNLNQTLVFNKDNYLNATYPISDFVQVPDNLATQIEYDVNGNITILINGIQLTYQVNYDDSTKLINFKLLTPSISYEQLVGEHYSLTDDFNNDPYGEEQSIVTFWHPNFNVDQFKLFSEVSFLRSNMIAKQIKVRYVDELGIEINDAQLINGNVGDSYDATTSQYKLDIDGYSLDEDKLPTNSSGVLSDQEQIVTYVYKKDLLVAEHVTIQYLDEVGNKLHDAQFISGNVGDNYDATTSQYKLDIEGYSLNEDNLPINSTGKLNDQKQIVVYEYKKDSVIAENITIQYVDTSGNKLHDAQFINGNIGDSYDATTSQYRLSIAGYSLDEGNMPVNGTGFLSNQTQIVTYVYKAKLLSTNLVLGKNDKGSITQLTQTMPKTKKAIPLLGESLKQSFLTIGLFILLAVGYIYKRRSRYDINK